jgi:PAS domain S-box-containing protein
MREEREHAFRRFLTHGVVDQAVGVLIARTGGPSAEAFRQLADLAERTGRPLLEIAADLVGEALPDEIRDAADEVRLRPDVLAMDRASGDADLARLLVGEALGWSGASAAAVAVVQPDDALLLAGSTGFPARSVSQWGRIPPALDCLLTRAVRAGAPVWVDTSSRDVPPLLGEPRAPAAPQHGTRLAVPLTSGRRLFGAVEIAWTTGTRFDPDQRREIAAVARAVAPSLVRSSHLALSSASSASSASAASAADRPPTPPWQVIVDGFAEAAVLLAPTRGAGDAVTGFRVVSANRTAVDLLDLGTDPAGRRLVEAMPWLAEAFPVLRDAFDSGGPARIEQGPWADRGGFAAARGALRLRATRVDDHLLLTAVPLEEAEADPGRWDRLQRLGRLGSWEWDLRTGQATWSKEALKILGSRSRAEAAPLDSPPYTVHPDDVETAKRFAAVLTTEGRPTEVELRVLHDHGVTGHIRLAGVPVLDSAGRAVSVFGVVQDVSPLRRTETALEIARVQLAAQRSRVDAERQVAVLLQQIIMPDEPVRPSPESGVVIAARYRPASASAGVGGDWYGVFILPDSKVVLTIGDVAGHGLSAASVMAQLYHTAHGLALTGAGPAELLHWLNTLTCERPAFAIASSCCAIYDPADRRLRWANAGHPSPVLVTADGAEPLQAPIGTMLGAVASSGYQEAEMTVEPGDHLLLYTDGLVERRRQSDEEATEHLLDMAVGPDPDLEAYVGRILAGARSDTDDDTCLIAVRFL